MAEGCPRGHTALGHRRAHCCGRSDQQFIAECANTHSPAREPTRGRRGCFGVLPVSVPQATVLPGSCEVALRVLAHCWGVSLTPEKCSYLRPRACSQRHKTGGSSLPQGSEGQPAPGIPPLSPATPPTAPGSFRAAGMPSCLADSVLPFLHLPNFGAGWQLRWLSSSQCCVQWPWKGSSPSEEEHTPPARLGPNRSGVSVAGTYSAQ